jgi:dihydroceramidase
MALAIVGLMGILLHPWAERRYKVAFFAVVIVGIGSICFHGTLQKFSQALDEVPMLYSALSFLFITLCQRYPMKENTRRILATVLFCHAAITTYLVTAFEGTWQFIFFHISFGTAQIFAFYQMFHIYRGLKRKGSKGRYIGIFEEGLVYYFCSFACWLTDMLGCEYLNPWYDTAVVPFNPQFHAWWHLLISMGLYNLSLFTLFHRVATKYSEKHPRVVYLLWIVPVIKIDESKKIK